MKLSLLLLSIVLPMLCYSDPTPSTYTVNGSGYCRIAGADGQPHWGEILDTTEDAAKQLCSDDSKCMAYAITKSGIKFQFYCSEATTLCNDGGADNNLVSPDQLIGADDGNPQWKSCKIKNSSTNDYYCADGWPSPWDYNMLSAKISEATSDAECKAAAVAANAPGYYWGFHDSWCQTILDLPTVVSQYQSGEWYGHDNSHTCWGSSGAASPASGASAAAVDPCNINDFLKELTKRNVCKKAGRGYLNSTSDSAYVNNRCACCDSFGAALITTFTCELNFVRNEHDVDFNFGTICSENCHYFELAEGTVCPSENEVIRSQDECTNALQQLGYSTSSWWTGSSSAIPAGCSAQVPWPTGLATFEESSAGVGVGRDNQRPICKYAWASRRSRTRRLLDLAIAEA